jgi:L-ribulose-5-phosphate 3-epimerase
MRKSDRKIGKIEERLGVLTDEVSPHLSEALEWAADNQLSHVEIRTVEGMNVAQMTDRQLLEIRREAHRRGLIVSAVASPLFKCALDPTRPVTAGDMFGQQEETVEEHFAKLQRCLVIARMLETQNIRIFSFWREGNPEEHVAEIALHLKRAADIAAKSRVTLLLENEPSCNGGYADEVGRLVRAVGSSSLRTLWDPGNEEYGDRPAFPEGYGFVRDTVAHVHLKDAIITPDKGAHCVPIGSGRVPFAEHLQALERNGYRGLYTIETHYIPDGGTAMDGTQLSLRELKRIIGEVQL